MIVYDNKLQNKGAAASSNEVPNGSNLFTYIVADEQGNNLHIYRDEEQDQWINNRDNGTALNMDASMIEKLLSSKNHA